MNFTNTKLSMRRPITDYAKIQMMWGAVIRNNKYQLNFIDSTKKNLNVGCGPHILNNFINLDYNWRPGIDLCWDIIKGIPFSDKSFSGIYSEHCLEHISQEDCASVLKEFRRLLMPGGVVRIVVPDAELYLDLYQKNKNGEMSVFPYPEKDMTSMMYVNRVFRRHDHLFGYDAATLKKMLEAAGFVEIRKESFQTGREKALLIDTQSRAIESLYMEASVL